MLVGFVENKQKLKLLNEKKFYIYYLAGYPVSGKILAGYPKSVSGTTLILSDKDLPPNPRPPFAPCGGGNIFSQ